MSSSSMVCKLRLTTHSSFWREHLVHVNCPAGMSHLTFCFLHSVHARIFLEIRGIGGGCEACGVVCINTPLDIVWPEPIPPILLGALGSCRNAGVAGEIGIRVAGFVLLLISSWDRFMVFEQEGYRVCLSM